jgi:hypothetical protein
MYFTLRPDPNDISDPLTEAFLISLVNMLNLKSGFRQILQILRCVIEILEIEIDSSQSEDRESLAIVFFLKSSLLVKIEEIYYSFHSSPEMIETVGQLLALCSKGRLIFPLTVKRNSFLHKISQDILTQTSLQSSENMTNYGHGLDALSLSKIKGNKQILCSYSACLTDLTTCPKSYQLACQLFGLILVTDWSEFKSAAPRASSSSFRRLLSWPAARPRSTSFSTSSSSSSSSSTCSSSSFSLDEGSVVPAILDKSLECLDYHLKVLPAHFPARAHLIQLASLAYRTLFYSPLSVAPTAVVSRYHSAIQTRLQSLHLDSSTLHSPSILSAVEDCLLCLDQTTSPRSLSPSSSLRTYSFDSE